MPTDGSAVPRMGDSAERRRRSGEKYATVRRAHRRQDTTGSLDIVYSAILVANLAPNLVDCSLLNTNLFYAKPC